MTRKLFISYAWKDDSPFAEKLYKFLGALKDSADKPIFDVWWDKARMTSDIPFSQVIQEAIKPCERLLVIAGPAAYESVACNGEWVYARKQCIPVIALLRVGDFPDLPDWMRSVLGVDCRPSRDEGEVWNEIARILAAEPPLPVTPHGAPALPAAYIERNQYLDPLKTAIKTGDPLIGITSKPDATALHGVGGIGKTTLVAALCRDCDVRRTFTHIFWIEVGPNRGKDDVPSLMYTIGATFGDSFEQYKDLNTARAIVTYHLRDKKTLIVLDDVWQGEVAPEFLFNGIDCRVVVTSRVKDLLRAGWASVGVDKLDERESLRLIAEILGTKADLFPPECAEIVRILDGHTLAVSIAARHMFDKGGVDYAPRLLERLQKRIGSDNPFRDLELSETNKNENLELSLSLSYEDLREDLGRRFRQLGVFAADGSFDMTAAAAIWNDEDVDDTEDALAALVRVGLVGQLNHRYTLHQLVHTYAHALLLRAKEFDAVFDRYADFYTAQADEIFDLPPEEWSQYEGDLPDVIALGDALRIRTDNGNSGDLTRAMEYANATIYYVHRRIESRKWVWLEMGLNATRNLRSQSPEDKFLMRGESLFLNDLGSVWNAVGEGRKALEFYEQSLALKRLIGDKGGEAATINNIARVWDEKGNKRKALEYYEQALPLFRLAVDRKGEAACLNNIAAVWSALGEQHKALEVHEQVLLLRRSVGDRSGEATSLNNIGAAWAALGDKRKALECYEQALPLRQEVGDQNGEAYTLNNISTVWRALGEKGKALELFIQALSLFRSVGNQSGEATALTNIADIYYEQGNFEQVINVTQHVLRIDRIVGDVSGESTSLYGLAAVYSKIGLIDQAIQSAAAGRDILIRYNLPQNAGGATVAHFDSLLAQLRSRVIRKDDQQTTFVHQIIALYRQSGAEVVRSVLVRAGAPENVIADWLAKLAKMDEE